MVLSCPAARELGLPVQLALAAQGAIAGVPDRERACLERDAAIGPAQ